MYSQEAIDSHNDESVRIWQQCRLSFRRSQGDLIATEIIDPAVQQHMEIPPVLATLDEHSEAPLSIHYFAASRDEYDSDSEVECVAMPVARTSFSHVPMVPLLRRNYSSFDSDCR